MEIVRMSIADMYFKDKKIHRDDGPAVVFHDGRDPQFWVDNSHVSESVWFNQVGRHHLKGIYLTKHLLQYSRQRDI